MKGLIQRVSHAQVNVAGRSVGAIEKGILLLLGIEAQDTTDSADKLLNKVLNYRIFPDEKGRMNLNLTKAGGGLLIVSQFTLVAETDRGLRPSFSRGASPEYAQELYNYFINSSKAQFSPVASGVFAADMQISLINDGPVTFMLET
ncbi:D-tyrosyl-tRNA(Tyr) deacylase [Microbulbifer sp. A4B17]|uniref:D-aminoacyl-tRNA deacylase n=1 Tax=Microbulbifer sp. A4B17 TaxID=359370 RepID=UPI000D52B76C|nr:D-aminoacyl-tRNA deacylase [Microbulbifer sp. A4B17]AWF83093.1 D-tyrosyl-tRNA(Tyr) deacylase [Microbulbifer sp. A4B17]